MKIQTTHLGADRPFERDRHLELRCIPEGATIRSATAHVTPVSADAAGQFVEAIGFTGNDGDWGAFKRAVGTSVELDLRARRRMASIVGSGISASSVLLVDLGGGFNAVGADGSIGGSGNFDLILNAGDLPGLSVTGVRITGGSTPDVATLRVSSPPSNVSLALDGGPAFWTHVGDLVDPAVSSDFSILLQESLGSSAVEHGHHVIGLAVHSDSIARLDVRLDIEYDVATSALPDGVASVSVPYSFGSTPDAAAGALSLSVPAGSVAVAGSTAGRVRGAFDATRVVHGSIGPVAIAGQATVAPGASHAQPIRTEQQTLATSVDLYVAAVTASAELAIDVVDDLDGKPGRTSLLSKAASRSTTRDEAPDSTWLNVPLPDELELLPDRRYWLVVHARSGTVNWALGSADEGPTLQVTSDDGLSWRARPHAIEAGFDTGHLRLRAATQTFHMPLELRVDAGGEQVPVGLGRFADAGRIDFGLDFPEIADAINAAVDAAGGRLPLAEHVENGDFDHWFRLGSRSRPLTSLPVPGPAVPAFSADGATAYLATRDRLIATDTYCGAVTLDVELAMSEPTTVVVDPTGALAIIAGHASSVEFTTISVAALRLTLVDLAAARVIGAPISLGRSAFSSIAATADGSGVYVIRVDDGNSLLARVGWEQLRSTVSVGEMPTPNAAVEIPAAATAIAVGPDGLVYVATIADGSPPSVGVFAAELGAASLVRTLPVPGDEPVRALAVTSSGAVAVVTEQNVAIVDARSGRSINAEIAITGGRDIAADPLDDVVWVVSDSLVRVDVVSGSVSEPILLDNARRLAISPPGNRLVVTTVDLSQVHFVGLGQDVLSDWELTGGEVRPVCDGTSHRALAVLGRSTSVGTPVVDAAMSQVVPVQPASRYRLAFAAGAAIEGARAELLWRTSDCGAERVDTIPIDVIDGSAQLHDVEHVVTSPANAVAVEVRFHSPEGELRLGSVSLSGTTESVGNSELRVNAGSVAGWEGSGVSASVGSGGETIVSGASGPARLSQLIPISGTRFQLAAVARSTTDVPGSAVTVEFADAVGAPVSDVVRLAVDRFTFDRLAAVGDVPDDAVEALLSIAVPAGATVGVDHVSLEFLEPIPVTLEFVSDAPGEIVVSDMTIGIDEAPLGRPPMSDDGPCPPTPPDAMPGEDCDSCCCTSCGERAPIRQPVVTSTASGRPAVLSPCPECGDPRLSIRGRRVVGMLAESRNGFVVNASPGRRSGRLVSAPPIEEVRGIAGRRAAELAELGIDTLAALRRADPDVVAGISGVSAEMARDFIAQAARLLGGTVRLEWTFVPERSSATRSRRRQVE